MAKTKLDTLRSDLSRRVADNVRLAAIQKAVAEGKADHVTLARLAELMGKETAAVLTERIKADTAEGFLSSELAQELIPPMLSDGHAALTKAAVTVQNDLNQKAGIGLKAVSEPMDADRARGIVQKATAKPLAETVGEMGRNVVNFHQNVVDSFVRKNAEVQARAGLRPRVIRVASGKACEWCRSLAGTYDYADVRDGEVWHRHANCNCTVSFDARNGKLQDAWKKTFHEDRGEAAIAQRQRAEYLAVAERALRDRGEGDVTRITDAAISNVPLIKLPGQTEEDAQKLRELHQELLRVSRDKNNHGEVAFFVSSDLSRHETAYGSDTEISFGQHLMGGQMVVLHNHPRNSSFSRQDILFLMQSDSTETLTIVKNNGSVEALTKLNGYDKMALANELRRAQKKMTNGGTDAEWDAALSKIYTKLEKKGVIQWQEK